MPLQPVKAAIKATFVGYHPTLVVISDPAAQQHGAVGEIKQFSLLKTVDVEIKIFDRFNPAKVFGYIFKAKQRDLTGLGDR